MGGTVTMARLLIAALLGGLVHYLWGTLSWTVLPFHTMTMNQAPDEAGLSAALAALPESGVYYIPGMPHDHATGAATPEQVEAWAARHRAGPLASIYLRLEGAQPMSPRVFAVGFLLSASSAFLVALILKTAAIATYRLRAAIGALIGVFLAIQADLMLWNYMFFPLDHTLAMMLDAVAGWTLAGLAIAAVMRPARPAPPLA